MKIPLDVKNAFQQSDSLDAHIQRRLDKALRSHAPYIRQVELRLSDANGPRGGSNDKVARIAVTLVPSGRIVATAAADDVYVSVNRAATRAKMAVTRHLTRSKRLSRYPSAGSQPHRPDGDGAD